MLQNNYTCSASFWVVENYFTGLPVQCRRHGFGTPREVLSCSSKIATFHEIKVICFYS